MSDIDTEIEEKKKIERKKIITGLLIGLFCFVSLIVAALITIAQHQ
ncbi:MAG: hypothetical protein HQK84_03445 [Nitrospinae bacterium]|nr:hypothetical protein [Nitrospinota bacterium]